MKTLFTMFVALILSVTSAKAQVTNDDCSNATDLGNLVSNSGLTTCLNGVPNTPVNDSTDLAKVNYPYPSTTVSCTGYQTAAVMPGKDRWYKFHGACDIYFAVENSDSLFLSFWIGDSCANMLPVACYNIPAGAQFSQTIPFVGPYQMWLQITGTDSVVNTSYNMCLATTVFACVPTYSFTDPTPVRCFSYETNVTPCSNSSAADGSIDIQMLNGNAPYSIQWLDFAVGFQRNNLTDGTYEFLITDNGGCSVIDSAIVSVVTGVHNQNLLQNNLHYDALSHTLIIRPDHDLQQFLNVKVYDAAGRLQYVKGSVKEGVIHLPDAKGVYMIRCSYHDDVITLKAVIN